MSTTTSEFEPGYSWDFFLAHAGADLPVAQQLYVKLTPPAKVFLDEVSLIPGDDWATLLPAAQQSSLISVIIVSPNTERAYYQREEIAAAIEMAREDPLTHRVVPVYIDSKQISRDQIPYGLRLKHSLTVPDSGDFTETGNRLLKTLDVMRQYEAKKVQVVAEQRIAVSKITTNSSGTEVLAAFNKVTEFVRPLLYTLLILLMLTVVVLIVCALTPSDERLLLVGVLGSVCALLLAGVLWLMARSLKYAPQIAQGRINGG